MKQQFTKRPHRSVLDRLREAETAEEIDRQLAIGMTFDDVSETTRNRWRKQAKKRRQEIDLCS